tara:strand:+ start:945 stop:1217 length:273 start_codon:yes stop_codon:yes gene_type:complete
MKREVDSAGGKGHVFSISNQQQTTFQCVYRNQGMNFDTAGTESLTRLLLIDLKMPDKVKLWQITPQSFSTTRSFEMGINLWQQHACGPSK